MGLEGGGRDPTPMDWIWSTRSYGMEIRYTTTTEGKVSWDGETVLYGKIQFSMTQMQNMVHTLVDKARRRLMEGLLMVELDMMGQVNKSQVPAIHVNGMLTTT